ncbi:MAG TPA: FAD-binding dehydrogenase [Microbacteriaceae bacterium]|nr:FAD-binding dehydrogenase [Microbacteriaceae bacterium]
MNEFTPDAVVVGAGLAGLVAAYELTQAGHRVLVIEQENRQNLGAQAHWSLGGLFLVDSPEQRRMGIKDSAELALKDWLGSADFDSPNGDDKYGLQWAKAYVEWAANGKRKYLKDLGLKLLPFVGWAERGSGSASGHGNSVPRFHLTWGTGPGVVEIFKNPVLRAEAEGLLKFAFRHRVDEIILEDGKVSGVRGSILEESKQPRGQKSSRKVTDSFEVLAPFLIVTTGGIGHNFELMRKNWPTHRLGPAPKHMIAGVPDHVDGRMLEIAEVAGAKLVNSDRMWAYTEGIHNWNPVWPNHAIRIIPGPSSMWFDATGNRLASPNFPGFDSLGTMREILKTGYDYSWFVLTQKIIEKEFALSGSEQNPDITERDLTLMIRSRLAKGAPAPVEAFKKHGVDFVVAKDVDELVTGMNKLSRDGAEISTEHLKQQIIDRDSELENKFSKDMQLMAIRNARESRTDRLIRVAPPHRILDSKNGPLIAVRLNILSRKTLGGIQTNLDSQVISQEGTPIEGFYAAGEVAGFGGGGLHGKNALEGTFLGGCIFSGRAAGRAIASRKKPA